MIVVAAFPNFKPLAVRGQSGNCFRGPLPSDEAGSNFRGAAGTGDGTLSREIWARRVRCVKYLPSCSGIKPHASKQIAKARLTPEPVEPRMHLEPHQRSVAFGVGLLQPIERALVIPDDGVVRGDAVG